MPRTLSVAALCLLAGIVVVFSTADGVVRGIEPVKVASPLAVTAGPLALPKLVRFETNRGQAVGGARYVARGSGRAMTFDETALSIRAGESAVRIGFAGPGAQPAAELGGPLSGVSNYLLGADRRGWVTGVAGYGSLVYRGVRPGVDAWFYGRGAELEMDFVIAPQADPTAVVLEIEGAESLEIDAHGRLLVDASDERLVLDAPVSFQPSTGVAAIEGLSDGARSLGATPVESSYRLLDETTVGFEIGEYDVARPLVIDPVLLYSTYLGGPASDTGEGIATDAAGNAYLVGATQSTSFPTTPGAYQPACAGAACADGFIAKLDPSGALVFSTFIGGSDGDGIHNVEVHPTTGDIHFVGTTTSSDFPVSAGAYQGTYAGFGDAIVGTLDASGSTLISATYLGGSSSEGTVDIAIDAAGNAYITGQTVSCDLPTTAGAFQPTDPFCGLFDAFVAKIDPSATAAFYVTYLGADDGSDVGFGIDVDGGGHAYVTGFAGSLNFPTTGGSFQPANAGGTCATIHCTDGFVSKLLPDGSGLVYSTYLGGTGGDSGRDIRVDAAGNAYIAGHTEATDFPTVAPFQAALTGGLDAFVAVLDPAGSALLSSSYLGGTSDDIATRLALVAPGDLWLTGSTTSTDFPVVDAVQAASGGGRDVFVSHVDTSTSTLVSSSYLGGIGEDFGRDIAAAGTAALGVGFTDSIDFPTVSPIQGAFGGGTFDAFAFKIDDGPLVVMIALSGNVNPRSRGVIPVAILTTPAFDATTINPATARFGPAEAAIAHAGGHIDDVDGDGDDDLQLHFRIPATGIACGDTEATLTAATFGGAPITATAPIRTVGC
jgi:hypothetical protein